MRCAAGSGKLLLLLPMFSLFDVRAASADIPNAAFEWEEFGELVILSSGDVEVRIGGENYGTVKSSKTLHFAPGGYDIEFHSGGNLLDTVKVQLVAKKRRTISWPRRLSSKPAAPSRDSDHLPSEESWPGSDGILRLLNPNAAHASASIGSLEKHSASKRQMQKPEAFFVLQRSSLPSSTLPFSDKLLSAQPNLGGSQRAQRPTDNDLERDAYLAMQRAFRVQQTRRDKKEHPVGTRLEESIRLFETSLAKYPHARSWTPDAMFALAELYYYRDTEKYDDLEWQYQELIDSGKPPTTPPPRADYGAAVKTYRQLVATYPDYRLVTAALYYIGFCLWQMDQEPEARQALLGLVCANKYRPLDPPTGLPSSAGIDRDTLMDLYKDCRPMKQDSGFLPEAWMHVAEMHFDASELAHAISAYGWVVQFKDSSYYDKAIYKLAWSYYRDNRFIAAVRYFDGLVKWADAKKASGDKFGSDLRPEAVQYLGISFSEADWDGDTIPDRETGLQRAQAFYRGREAEPHVKEVFQRMGDIYFDLAQYTEAIATYRWVLEKWPYWADAPKAQHQIVRAYERQRNTEMAAKENDILGQSYLSGKEWYRRNQNNPEVLAVARQLTEGGMLSAAVNSHTAAQTCRTRHRKSKAVVDETCRMMYSATVARYEQYLAAFPESERAEGLRMFFAEALHYSGQDERASAVYTSVRDSDVDLALRQDAALMAIESLERLLLVKATSGRLALPAMPVIGDGLISLERRQPPEPVEQLVSAYDTFIRLKPKARAAPTYALRAATILIQFRELKDARARLEAIYQDNCREAVATDAARAIAFTHRLERNTIEEHRWTVRASDGSCGLDHVR